MNAGLPPNHFAGPAVAGPRFREAGDLTLDRFHQDARVEDVWLSLNLRDFAMLWRLAECPGVAVSDTHLAADLWQIRFGAETASIGAQIDRLRARLEAAGLAHLIASDGDSGYFLDVSPAAVSEVASTLS